MSEYIYLGTSQGCAFLMFVMSFAFLVKAGVGTAGNLVKPTTCFKHAQAGGWGRYI